MKCSASVRCTHPGCKETGFYEFHSRREMAENYPKRQQWKCYRHQKPEEVLSLDCVEITSVSINQLSKENGLHFWDGLHGLKTGPGFKAYADDFPEGTKLLVTAKILTPNPTH